VLNHSRGRVGGEGMNRFDADDVTALHETKGCDWYA
jgi:hypothetical protein